MLKRVIGNWNEAREFTKPDIDKVRESLKDLGEALDSLIALRNDFQQLRKEAL